MTLGQVIGRQAAMTSRLRPDATRQQAFREVRGAITISNALFELDLRDASLGRVKGWLARRAIRHDTGKLTRYLCVLGRWASNPVYGVYLCRPAIHWRATDQQPIAPCPVKGKLGLTMKKIRVNP